MWQLYKPKTNIPMQKETKTPCILQFYFVFFSPQYLSKYKFLQGKLCWHPKLLRGHWRSQGEHSHINLYLLCKISRWFWVPTTTINFEQLIAPPTLGTHATKTTPDSFIHISCSLPELDTHTTSQYNVRIIRTLFLDSDQHNKACWFCILKWRQLLHCR